MLQKIHINLGFICQTKRFLSQRTSYGVTALEVMKLKQREKFIKHCRQELKVNFDKVR